jgi:hypothetical protein
MLCFALLCFLPFWLREEMAPPGTSSSRRTKEGWHCWASVGLPPSRSCGVLGRTSDNTIQHTQHTHNTRNKVSSLFPPSLSHTQKDMIPTPLLLRKGGQQQRKTSFWSLLQPTPPVSQRQGVRPFSLLLVEYDDDTSRGRRQERKEETGNETTRFRLARATTQRSHSAALHHRGRWRRRRATKRTLEGS